MKRFKIGEVVYHTDPHQRLVVVDIDPPDVLSPYPCYMLAVKTGDGKVHEFVVEAKYLTKVAA